MRSSKGIDLFITEPDTVEEMYCVICGSKSDVERSLLGPTSGAMAMAKRGKWHDRFTCPHVDQPWHLQACDLYLEIKKTPSKRLAELMELDLEDILSEHGPLK
jgi:hypothetical protein